MNQQKYLSRIAPLFLVLFIDAMGLGLLFPVLSGIIFDPRSGFLAASASIESRNFLYGLTVGLFMIFWFFGAAILGDLSDTVGRKKVLLICLMGSFFGYLLSAIAVFENSFIFLIFGRVIAGFTAGSQAIAQAAIVDVSTPQQKARNLGLILLAISLGFVLGPIIGGVLSDYRLVSSFSFSTPLYFAAAISLINAGLLLWMFKETFHRSEKISINLSQAINVFISAFQHKKVRALSVVFFVMIYGWSNFFTFISPFALHRYAFSSLKVSLLLADMGIGFSIGCGFLVNFLGKRFLEKTIIIWNFSLAAIFILFIVLIHDKTMLWIMMVPIGATISAGYSTILAVFSNQVSDNEQGWVMGVTSAVMALCFGLSALLTGYLANFGAEVPIYLAVVGMGISAALLSLVRVGAASTD